MFNAIQLLLTKAIVDNSADSIVICDMRLPDAPIIFANAAFTDMTGYSADEVIGKNCRFLQNADRQQDGARRIKEAVSQQQSVRTLLRNYRRDGTPFWNELTIYPIRDELGEEHYFAGIQRDVTRVMENEEALLRGRDELERRVDERTAELMCANALLHQEIGERRRAESELRASKENLQKLGAHQEHIKEKERKRIAREIHDELGGLLTGIKAYLSVEADQARRNGAPADAPLLQATRLADTAIGTVRRVITDLRPSVLDELGIWTAVEWYAERTAQRAGLNCTVHIDEQALDTELDPERSIALFRIVQEALTNVQRHAQASQVTVQAERDGVELLVKIIDDGKGINTEHVTRQESWGLVGMQERVGHFGGILDISGVPGQGTVITVHLPLQERAHGD